MKKQKYPKDYKKRMTTISLFGVERRVPAYKLIKVFDELITEERKKVNC